MLKTDRRDFIKKATYTVPAILTLNASLAHARTGSKRDDDEKIDDKVDDKSDKPVQERKDWSRYLRLRRRKALARRQRNRARIIRRLRNRRG